MPLTRYQTTRQTRYILWPIRALMCNKMLLRTMTETRDDSINSQAMFSFEEEEC